MCVRVYMCVMVCTGQIKKERERKRLREYACVYVYLCVSVCACECMCASACVCAGVCVCVRTLSALPPQPRRHFFTILPLVFTFHNTE